VLAASKKTKVYFMVQGVKADILYVMCMPIKKHHRNIVTSSFLTIREIITNMNRV
jgi:hypothetical protein